ncbi:MAG: helix-turn-helix domain-containing protein [Myxococcota bacterium]
MRQAVWVLALEGMFDTGLASVLDTLGMANELAPHVGEAAPFSIEVVSVRKRVRTQQGMTIPTVRVREASRPELILVPALGDKSPDALGGALTRRDVSDAAGVLVDGDAKGARLAAACTGTYLLASTGLLSRRLATTTWWLAADFRTRFSDVMLDESKMVVEDGSYVTAGAALAHVDLALWLVRQRSPALAQLVARYLLVDDRPSQTSYAMLDHLAHADPIVEAFERWTRSNLRAFSIAEAARAIGASERTLQRRLRKVLGRTPIDYVRDLRVERAIHLLRTSDLSVDEIAEEVGYGDGVTLRTLLRDKTGRGVRELRRGG